MSAISRFFGIVITMNYNNHAPPHFHIRYESQKALMSIDTLALIRGHLSPRVLGLAVEWAAQHQAELYMVVCLRFRWITEADGTVREEKFVTTAYLQSFGE